MTFLDWDHVCEGQTTVALDAEWKYAGNSSLRHSGTGRVVSSRKNFSASEVRVEVWISASCIGYWGTHGTAIVFHPSYGELQLLRMEVTGKPPFVKKRATFWYDSPNDTRWGRVEVWNGEEWVQEGYDVNFGTGAPAAGTISLIGSMNSGTVWWDEVEVYTR
ncbi:MAG: hypothetical protein QXV39_07995 [Candidatus Caldarchaeum sp.]